MTKYAAIDTHGNSIAFYDEDIHGARNIPNPTFKPAKNQTILDAPQVANPDTTIPVSAVPIPDKIWQRSINGTTQFYTPSTKIWATYVQTSAEKLAMAKVSAFAKINSDYQTALDAGVTYKTALFQSDVKSISTLTEVLTAISNGWSLPAGFAWIDATNTPHPASVAFLKGLSTAMANHKSALFARLQIAKAAIAAAKTKAATNKIVF